SRVLSGVGGERGSDSDRSQRQGQSVRDQALSLPLALASVAVAAAVSSAARPYVATASIAPTAAPTTSSATTTHTHLFDPGFANTTGAVDSPGGGAIGLAIMFGCEPGAAIGICGCGGYGACAYGAPYAPGGGICCGAGVLPPNAPMG